ncbi:hypothetical protein [Flavobacterium sp. AG291]|uniref:hypothetical protein n=1 Tax=Flavobacterium sp. AG291 TaxID=2184000 RepID=UPI000E0CB062|nr:hypothetical protein [Flavobacterium sp. AG291]RDI05334.1 hypothetical protein DEU42_1186 [Flavobacterium sp. AG291]
MNFNELQQQWNNEPTDNVRVPNTIDTLKEAQTPIDKVRKKMKADFFMQAFMLVLVGFAPLIFDFSDKLISLFIPFYAIMIGFMTYYFYKFFVFYKKSYDMTFDSRKNLLWFFYELKLNIELYKALTYIMFFLGFSFGVLAGTVTKNQNTISNFLDKKAAGITGIALLAGLILFSLFMAEFIPRWYYGKHLKQVKSVLDQLDEE